MGSQIRTVHDIQKILASLISDEGRRKQWMSTSFKSLNGKSPDQVISEGNASKVLRYLVESLDHGQYNQDPNL